MTKCMEGYDHTSEEAAKAAEMIRRLWMILGEAAVDIQFICRTAIPSTNTRRIFDIAVAIRDFDELTQLEPKMKQDGFVYHREIEKEGQRCVIAYKATDDIYTGCIHIMKIGGNAWQTAILLRDYLNSSIDAAREYEAEKPELADAFEQDDKDDGEGKAACIRKLTQEARIWEGLNRRFIQIKPILKGWSEDKKYCVTAEDGTKYLLRISSSERYEHRKKLFDLMMQVSALDVPMCQPIEFGALTDGVYALHSWIEGEDLSTAISDLFETEQYMLGIKSGEILRKIHTIPAPEAQEDWAVRFGRKTDLKIEKYHECAVHFDGDTRVLAYLKENRCLLQNRPQCLQHGDYHVGNMMLEDGELRIIDFDRYDFGDPWEEFNRISWCAQASPCFATGQLRGYFGGDPPLAFFKLLAFYLGSNMLSSLPWAIPFGAEEVTNMLNQVKDVMSWYDRMPDPVPAWYRRDIYIQTLDSIPFRLKAPFDFSFIGRYGRVFKVFDGQDGGNICFGTEQNGKRYFVKFAGAPQAGYTGEPKDAVARLRASVPVYQALGGHSTVIRFIESEAIGGGYATVFEWTDAVGIGRMYPKDHKRFMALPVEKKLRVFHEILKFHEFACDHGYVAIDFYDGSIMYDFEQEKTVICDIDFYQTIPYFGAMGLWGSSRFVSPEECKPGEKMDERTTVYTMGQTAFCLFTDSNHAPEAWPLSTGRYAVVKRAISDDRSCRPQSLRQLAEEWEREK